MPNRTLLALACSALLTGCATVTLPKTQGETASGYGYVPLDPLPIDQASGADSCSVGADGATSTAARAQETEDAGLLAKLPDQTVRFAVGVVDQTKGTVSFGPVTLTSKGLNYQAVLDYTQADAVPVQFWYRPIVSGAPDNKGFMALTIEHDPTITGYDVRTSIAQTIDAQLRRQNPLKTEAELADMKAAALSQEATDRRADGFRDLTVPIYVGVGLRVTADIFSRSGGISITGLSAIGADAEVNKLVGRLTVQSLGVTGKSITLPLPSKLDQTTVENAILAIGTMRASFYAADLGDGSVYLQPRIVGLYSPIGGNPLFVNAVYSELSKQRPRWLAPCMSKRKASPAPAAVAAAAKASPG